MLVGHDVVCVNIDETPIFRQVQPRKGYVIRTPAGGNPSWYARIPIRDRRGQSTLLATIVNDPELQAAMPQFVLTNDKNLSKDDKAKLRTLAAPLKWFPGTKGWMSPASLKPLLTAIRRAVRSKRPLAEVVMFMDCATVHTAEDVVAHCSKLGLHLCLIPGGMTYLLQPLDSHVFATVKRTLSEMQERKRGEHPLGILATGDWIDVLSQAVHATLIERSWASAFADNGLAPPFTSLRPRIRDVISNRLPLRVNEPTIADVERIVGRKREGLREQLLRASVRLANRPREVVVGSVLRLAGRLPSRVAPRGAIAGILDSESHGLPPLPPPVDTAPLQRLTRSGSRY